MGRGERGDGAPRVRAMAYAQAASQEDLPHNRRLRLGTPRPTRTQAAISTRWFLSALASVVAAPRSSCVTLACCEAALFALARTAACTCSEQAEDRGKGAAVGDKVAPMSRRCKDVHGSQCSRTLWNRRTSRIASATRVPQLQMLVRFLHHRPAAGSPPCCSRDALPPPQTARASPARSSQRVAAAVAAPLSRCSRAPSAAPPPGRGLVSCQPPPRAAAPLPPPRPWPPQAGARPRGARRPGRDHAYSRPGQERVGTQRERGWRANASRALPPQRRAQPESRLISSVGNGTTQASGTLTGHSGARGVRRVLRLLRRLLRRSESGALSLLRAQ